MTGDRINIANLKAKARYRKWYPEHTGIESARFGSLRKTNVMCSCQMCCNPRHSNFYNEVEKLTIQERKAPEIHEEWY